MMSHLQILQFDILFHIYYYGTNGKCRLIANGTTPQKCSLVRRVNKQHSCLVMPSGRTERMRFYQNEPVFAKHLRIKQDTLQSHRAVFPPFFCCCVLRSNVQSSINTSVKCHKSSAAMGWRCWELK